MSITALFCPKCNADIRDNVMLLSNSKVFKGYTYIVVCLLCKQEFKIAVRKRGNND